MIAASPPPVSIPRPVVVETVRYYEIKGQHEAELVSEMNSKGYRVGKSTYWGYTSPTVSWKFGAKQQTGQPCVLDNPRVSIHIVTTLPHWNVPAGTSNTVVLKWNKLFTALKHHEGEHGQIAKEQGDALVALMQAHPSDASCKQLNAYLHTEAQKIFQRDSERNTELDRRTHHGVDEGVAISW
jgi:predicted secreted Zn-dependent protease